MLLKHDLLKLKISQHINYDLIEDNEGIYYKKYNKFNSIKCYLKYRLNRLYTNELHNGIYIKKCYTWKEIDLYVSELTKKKL